MPDDYSDLDAMMKGHSNAAAANVVAAPAVTPQTAQKAVQVKPTAPSVVMPDPHLAEQQQQIQKNVGIVRNNPVVAQIAQDPVKASAVQDHMDWMDQFSKGLHELSQVFMAPATTRQTGGVTGALATGAPKVFPEGTAGVQAGVKTAFGPVTQEGPGVPWLKDWINRNVPGAQGFTQAAGHTGLVTLGLTNAALAYPYSLLKNIPGRILEAYTGIDKDAFANIGITAGLGALGLKAGAKPKGPIEGEVLPLEGFQQPERPRLPGPGNYAQQRADVIDAIYEEVQNSPVQKVSQPLQIELSKASMEGTPLENVNVSARAIAKYYTDNNMIPHEGDGAFGWIPGLLDKLKLGLQANGDLTIPLAEYVSNVSPEAHKAVHDDLRMGEEQSVNDEKLFREPVPGEEPVKQHNALEVQQEEELAQAGIHREGFQAAEEKHRPQFLKDEEAAGKGMAPGPDQGAVPSTEQSIAQAIKKEKEFQYLNTLFKDAKSAGMTEEQFKLYSKKLEDSEVALQKFVKDQTTKQLEHQQGHGWKLLAQELDPAVRQEIYERPDVIARHYLTYGELPDGSKPDIGPLKINRQDAIDSLPYPDGERLVGSMPDKVFGAKGQSPDDLAELFGYRSGEEMMRAIADLHQEKTFIDAQRDTPLSSKEHLERMVQDELHSQISERIGNHLSPSAIEDAAREAAASAEARNLLIQDLEVLAKQAGLPFDKEAILNLAEQNFSKLQVSEAINARELERLSGRNGREAEIALLKGKLVEAFRAKQAQLLNQHMLSQAFKFQKEFAKADAKFRSLAKAQQRASIPQEYLDRIHQALASGEYPIRRNAQQLREALGSMSLQDFIDSKQPAVISFRPWMPGPVKKMNVQDFRNLKDTVDSLVHNAQAEGIIQLGEARAKIEDLMERVKGQRSLYGDKLSLEQVYARSDNKTWAGRFFATWDGLTSAFRAIEFIIDRLDLEDPHGVWNDALFRPLQDGKHLADDLSAGVSKGLLEIQKKLPAKFYKALEQKLSLPELTFFKDGYTRRLIKDKADLINAALHWGNDENKFALVEGFNKGLASRLEYDDWANIFDRHMTKADWDFVQGLWDIGETLWKHSQDMEERLSGIRPVSVQPVEFDTPFGKYRGGHAPLFYDKYLGRDVKETGPQLFGKNFLRPLPSKSYLVERTGYIAPIELNLDNFINRIQQMIHDISFREPLLNAHKFMSQPEVKDALHHQLGPAWENQMRAWLNRIAGHKTADLDGMNIVDQWLRARRMNMIAAQIMWRASTPMKHFPTALAKSIDEVGAGPLKNAYLKMIAQGPQNVVEAVKQESAELRHRAMNVDRDFRAKLEQLMVKQGLVSQAQMWGMWTVGMSDYFSAIPTYIAARDAALARGATTEDAIYEGEKAIRKAHGASSLVDLPAYLAWDNETAKFLSMFMQFLNNSYNRAQDIPRLGYSGTQKLAGGDLRGAKTDYIRMFSKLFYVMIVPTLIDQWISFADHKKSFFHRFIDSFLNFATSSIPLVSQGTRRMTTGEYFGDNPIDQAIKNTVDAMKDAWAAVGMGGKVSERWIQNGLAAGGFFWRIPGAGQIGASTQYTYDVLKGTEHPHSLWDFGRGFLFGPTPKRSKK